VAPHAEWTNATGNLAGLESECGNLTLVSAKPGSDMVIAGVALRGLFATHDGGGSWSSLGSGDGSDPIVNRPSAIIYDPDHAETFWESGIYNGGGVYGTTDSGATFKQLGSISHVDLLSIDFTDPERKTMLAGGHEHRQLISRSIDGGQNWDNVGLNLPPEADYSSAPIAVDAQTHLVGCCGNSGGMCGIWRTTNGGADWAQASDLPPAHAPLRASDGTVYWSLDSKGGMAASSDQGQTWTRPAGPESGLIAAPPVELPDGRIVTLGADHLLISSDHAKSWQYLAQPLPFEPNGVVTYSAQTKTLFVSHWDCGKVVLADAIASAPFDYQVE
jgi:photosystem II stability/assembly factor-like uncharacterized protein